MCKVKLHFITESFKNYKKNNKITNKVIVVNFIFNIYILLNFDQNFFKLCIITIHYPGRGPERRLTNFHYLYFNKLLKVLQIILLLINFNIKLVKNI